MKDGIKQGDSAMLWRTRISEERSKAQYADLKQIYDCRPYADLYGDV